MLSVTSFCVSGHLRERPRVRAHGSAVVPVLVTANVLFGGSLCVLREASLARPDQQAVAGRLAAVDGHGRLDGLQAVDLARALLLAREAKVIGGAETTSAGDGLWPECVDRRRCTTSAEAPAVSGGLWPTPPNRWSGDGAPLKSTHPW